jgi:hypothetical protein
MKTRGALYIELAPRLGQFEVLSAADAATITRKLLEFEAINRKRELVNSLSEMGITPEKFAQWLSLHRQKSLGVTDNLIVDVTNMISHIDKGIETQEDALVRTSAGQVKKRELDAFNRQGAITGMRSAQYAANNDFERPRG